MNIKLQLRTPMMLQGQLKANFSFANPIEAQKFAVDNNLQSDNISFLKGMEMIELFAGVSGRILTPVQGTFKSNATLDTAATKTDDN